MTVVDSRAYLLGEEEGLEIPFLGVRMRQKAAGGETEGRFDLFDQHVPPAYAPPRHRHEREDEAWYVLEGEATFWCGAERFGAGPGAFVYLPRGIEHAFRAGAGGARLLTLTVPGGFGSFVHEVGGSAGTAGVGDAAPPDEEELAAIAARHGIVITGPPPR